MRIDTLLIPFRLWAFSFLAFDHWSLVWHHGFNVHSFDDFRSFAAVSFSIVSPPTQVELEETTTTGGWIAGSLEGGRFAGDHFVASSTEPSFSGQLQLHANTSRASEH